MSSFEVAVFQTAKLGDKLESNYGERYKASKAMRTFIEGAFNHSGNQHTVSVDNPFDDVYAPVQNVSDSISTNDPCGSPTTQDYNGLVYWWEDYVSCNLTERNDCMVLLTAKDSGSGSTWQNYYAVVEGGPDVAKLDGSYSEFGCGQKWEDMQNVLHEMAHAFLDENDEHDHGNVYQHDCGYFCSNWYRTPIGHGGDAGTNACYDDIPSDHDDSCNAMYWDPDCATDRFTNTTNHQ